MLVLFAIIVDLILGDPINFPQPWSLVDKIIDLEEIFVRRTIKNDTGLKIAGLFLSLINIAGVYFLTFYFLKFFDFNPILQSIIGVHICYTNISYKTVAKQAKIIKKDSKISLDRGRNSLRMTVSRNTDRLSLEGIIRATVEHVADNISEGIIGPVIFSLISIPLGSVFKILKIMGERMDFRKDSYKNLGLFPTLLKSLVNIIPARLASLVMIVSSIFKYDQESAIKSTKKYSSNSLNSQDTWPKSTMAGLLNIRLGGGRFYENIYVDKPYLGDDTRPVRSKDIDDSVSIMFRSLLLIILLLIVSLAIVKILN